MALRDARVRSMPRQITPSVGQAVEDYLASKRQASPGVRYGLRSILGRFSRFMGPGFKVGSLEPWHLEEFFYGTNGLNLTCSRTTLAKNRNEIKQFIAFCHRRRYITRYDPEFMVSGITEKSTKPNRDRYRLKPDELIALIEAAPNPRDRALIAFVANTGVRISEALSLRVMDLRLDRGEVYVTKTKQGDAEVTYPLTVENDAELRKWLTVYTLDAGNLEPGFYLFPAKRGKRFGDPDNPALWNPRAKINNPIIIIRDAAKAADIELGPGDGWHTLRRSVGRIFFDRVAAAGEYDPLRMTQALYGHAHAATTEVYLGIDTERRRVDAALRGKSFLNPEGDTNVTRIGRAVNG